MCKCRETLAAMMNKLTGDLRNTQPSEQPQASQQAGSRCSMRSGPPMPGTPQPHAGPACQSPQPARPGADLDHAPSLALIPSSKSLAVPASLTDEVLPTLQPLPGPTPAIDLPNVCACSMGRALLVKSAADHLLTTVCMSSVMQSYTVPEY